MHVRCKGYFDLFKAFVYVKNIQNIHNLLEDNRPALRLSTKHELI